MSSLAFRTKDGKSVDQLLVEVSSALQPNVGDLQYAGERLKTRILERTERGVDYQGRPFTPYNNTRPYYHYDGPAIKNEASAEERTAFTKKRRVKSSRLFSALFGKGKRVATVNAAKLGATDQFAAKTKGGGIRFSSYAAFKAAFGRTTVDLFGIKAPHMLQAIIVRAQGFLLTLGIYGDEARRAEAHNFGKGDQKKREFFNANAEDRQLMGADIAHRMAARAKTKL